MTWDDVAFRVEEMEGPAITILLGTLRQVYANGGVILRNLRIVDPPTFASAFRSDYRGTDNAMRTMLAHPTVIEGVPELKISTPFNKPPDFRWLSAFGMEGDLTNMLLNGGAYEKFRGTVDEARLMTREFMESMFGAELQTLWVSSSATPWTDWFCDIAWDSTFVVWDYAHHRLVLMCCTDTD